MAKNKLLARILNALKPNDLDKMLINEIEMYSKRSYQLEVISNMIALEYFTKYPKDRRTIDMHRIDFPAYLLKAIFENHEWV